MKTWRLIIDVSKCDDCNNCLLACKDEHVDNAWPGYTVPQPRHGHRWIDVARRERGQFPLVDVVYRPAACMQCAEAPCVAEGNGAVKKRDDGIVLIDPEKAKGQRQLIDSCPYGMIWWNEELGVPQKCTLCAHLLDSGWKKTRCVQACPPGALQVNCVDEEEMSRIAAAEKLAPLHPEFETRPRLLYKNLDRFDKVFVGGSVAVQRDGRAECAVGARVILSQADRTIAETETDAFGDFRFDDLEPNSTGYNIEVTTPGGMVHQVSIAHLESSINLGTVFFDADSAGAAKP